MSNVTDAEVTDAELDEFIEFMGRISLKQNAMEAMDEIVDAFGKIDRDKMQALASVVNSYLSKPVGVLPKPPVAREDAEGKYIAGE